MMKIWYEKSGNFYNVYVSFNGMIVGVAAAMETPEAGLVQLADKIFRYGK